MVRVENSLLLNEGINLFMVSGLRARRVEWTFQAGGERLTQTGTGPSVGVAGVAAA